ncbi:MAG: hypothetical protein KKD44_25775 [Proteobacteria bacterium]|nr:hypothetical protein [Pseudomonadota bacterium]
MDFDEEHKVKIDTLTEREADAFLDFLDREWDRHLREIKVAGEIKFDLKTRLPSIFEYTAAWDRFWDSAIVRHEQDIKAIEELKDVIREMFNL